MHILHLDDEIITQLALKQAFERSAGGVKITYQFSRTKESFFEQVKSKVPDCILIDLDLGDTAESGISITEQTRSMGINVPIVILSGTEDPQLMSEAIKKGASDFLSKSESLDALISGIKRCLLESNRQAAAESMSPSASEVSSTSLEDAVGATMRKVALKIDRVLEKGIAPILVRGESGTGKEQVAHMIEARLLGDKVPFLKINCASIQGETLESELFGHVKGAFTGADIAKKGLFEAADGGWLFLDEVARLSERTQAALLRTLESGEIRPLGSAASKNVNVRVVAATNENLEELCNLGLFRRDLLERLRAYEIELLPLRQRSQAEREEILNALLTRLCHGTQVSGESRIGSREGVRLDSATRKLLLSASWHQSNVREMWNVLKSAYVEATDGVISIACLPRYFIAEMNSVSKPVTPCDPSAKKPPKNITGEAGQKSIDDTHEGSLSQKRALPEQLQQSALEILEASVFSTAPIDLRKSYEILELEFFAKVAVQLGLVSPDKIKSIRALATALRLGRHVVSKKIVELEKNHKLPIQLTHLAASIQK